jgi:GR25 family glycosyltransferase involved in LPS biosynthesis
MFKNFLVTYIMSVSVTEKIGGITDIKHTLYINLSSRVDRKEHVEKELGKIGIPFERFNAIKLPNGALGCSMSHLKCLQIAKEMGWSHVFICEDEIQFIDPELLKKQLDTFLKTHSDDWDVLLVAGNNMPPYIPIDESCVQVKQCQTTTGYIVKQHYYDTLITNFKLGIQCLMREPHKHSIYAIDKYWFFLQQQDRWFLIVPLTVVQRTDYSDIEKRMVNYKRIMTDLDKTHLIQRMNQM